MNRGVNEKRHFVIRLIQHELDTSQYGSDTLSIN
jgi:hypothetical protein